MRTNDMTQQEFYEALSKTTKAYSWSIEDNKITGTVRSGKDKGQTVSPVTAVCRSKGHGVYRPTKAGTRTAAKKLGLSSGFTSSAYEATTGSTNRGNGQVVRGRVRQALGL